MKRKHININYIDSPVEVVDFRLVYEELPLSLHQTTSEIAKHK